MVRSGPTTFGTDGYADRAVVVGQSEVQRHRRFPLRIEVEPQLVGQRRGGQLANRQWTVDFGDDRRTALLNRLLGDASPTGELFLGLAVDVRDCVPAHERNEATHPRFGSLPDDLIHLRAFGNTLIERNERSGLALARSRRKGDPAAALVEPRNSRGIRSSTAVERREAVSDSVASDRTEVVVVVTGQNELRFTGDIVGENELLHSLGRDEITLADHPNGFLENHIVFEVVDDGAVVIAVNFVANHPS